MPVSVACDVEMPSIDSGTTSCRTPITVSRSVFPVCGSRTTTGTGAKRPSSTKNPDRWKSGTTAPVLNLSRRGATIGIGQAATATRLASISDPRACFSSGK